ncbi:hypothetical protein [Haloechinothrix sp. LS1_15]|uniref:hypothetical protein n=1 Tax=Haloechinothrix sp. LS1_15 TaxID=2652248 RepID=UPI0029457873|nr:hypothetical protein [Haloechinothrix sp. LS1_15]MDV6011143.1 hypothetical protein [Haloechinothrix sp. LS1_15]
MTSEVIGDTQDKFRELEERVADFFDKANDALSWVPGQFEHLIEPIRDGLDRLRQKIDELWSKVNEFLDNSGDPDKLNRFADEWSDAIGNPVGNVAANVKLDHMRTNIEWTGRAAEAYKANVPRQSELLEKIQSVAIEIRDSLRSLANGIETFWIAVAFAVASALVAITGAIAGLAGVVTIPAGIAAAAGGVSALIASAGVAVTEIKALMDKESIAQESIVQKAEALGDEWATSSFDLSDIDNWEPF